MVGNFGAMADRLQQLERGLMQTLSESTSRSKEGKGDN